MKEPKKEPAVGVIRDRLPNASQPSNSTAPIAHASATVIPLKRARITAARRASWRLAELIRLALWRRAHGVVVDADAFAFVLAATLASAPTSVSNEGRGGRAVRWRGLDLLSLREACAQAELGRITDDELGTKMVAVSKWQVGNAGKTLRPDSLAQILSLSAIERAECGIRTIGAVDESLTVRRERQKQAKRKTEAERLRAKRVGKHIPRAVYLERSTDRQKPWEAAGVSRRTWFYRKAQLEKLFSPGHDVRAPAVTAYLASRARDFRELRNPMLMVSRCSQGVSRGAAEELADWSLRMVQTISFAREVVAVVPCANVYLGRCAKMPLAIVSRINAAQTEMACGLRIQAHAIAQSLAA